MEKLLGGHGRGRTQPWLWQSRACPLGLSLAVRNFGVRSLRLRGLSVPPVGEGVSVLLWGGLTQIVLTGLVDGPSVRRAGALRAAPCLGALCFPVLPC